MDNLVEIACFKDSMQAQVLVSLLRSEGIECTLRNELVSQVLGWYVGSNGVCVDVMEADAPQALALMNEHEFPVEDFAAEEASRIERLTSWTDKIPGMNRLPAVWRVVLLFVVVALGLTAILLPAILHAHAG